MQSKRLTRFYQAYLAWAEDGAPYGTCFMDKWGLCTNALNWADEFDYNSEQLLHEMKEQFASANLDDEYPFGYDEYREEVDMRSHHTNPIRLNWVRSHAV